MRALGIALLFAFAGPAIADRDVPAALQPYMTEEEYLAAGLDKLNPAELAALRDSGIEGDDLLRTLAPQDPRDPAALLLRLPGIDADLWLSARA